MIRIKYRIINKASTIDFVEAFYVYRLFAFAYRELEVRIVAVPQWEISTPYVVAKYV